MFGKKSENLFLRSDEKILYSFDYRKHKMLATNHRLVIQSGGNAQDEFDYKYIAHMNLESEYNRRLIGILCLLLGLFYMAANLAILTAIDFVSPSDGYSIIPIFFIALGIYFLRMKEHTLYIHLSGVAQSFEYKLPGSKYNEAQRLILVISDQRRQL
jgi:hypothetical protein